MGTTLRLLSIGLVCALLGACTPSSAPSLDNKDISQRYASPLGYEIDVPSGYSYAENAPNNDYFYFGYSIDSPISIRTIELHEIGIPCTPSLIGVSQPSPLTDANGKAEWGRVTYWDRFPHDVGFSEPEPHCRPASGNGNAYALCSEKNGKTVVICISQVTDDPALAKQIFETFRWTE